MGVKPNESSNRLCCFFFLLARNLGYFRSVKPSKTSFFACHFACLFVPLPPKTNTLKRKMKDTILILSGGMDSTTMLYEYKDRIAMAISFDYGANHNRREIKCASLHCERLGITHAVIPLDFMRRYFRSSLLDGAEAIPEGHYDDENMHSTVVPFRNGIMLSIAVGIVEAFDRAAEAGTFNGVRLLSPYCHMTKADIARRGKELGIDYSETWSCYKGEDVHCGRCGTCVERREALAEAGIEDTTEYAE